MLLSLSNHTRISRLLQQNKLSVQSNHSVYPKLPFKEYDKNQVFNQLLHLTTQNHLIKSIKLNQLVV